MPELSAQVREIKSLLDRAHHFTYGDGADPEVSQALATESIGRALLALIPLVAEIGDQLDRLPTAMRCSEVDRHGQRCHKAIGHAGKHSVPVKP